MHPSCFNARLSRATAEDSDQMALGTMLHSELSRPTRALAMGVNSHLLFTNLDIIHISESVVLRCGDYDKNICHKGMKGRQHKGDILEAPVV